MERGRADSRTNFRVAREFLPQNSALLAALKEEATQPEKITEYQKTKYLAKDIVNSRLRKIVALSTAPGQSDQVLKKLSNEEKILYEAAC